MPFIQEITTASGGTNFVPLTRTLSINGVTYDLTADRSWTISTSGTGTVTSVALASTMPTGLTASISGSPITSSGTLNLNVSFASGYSIPTNAKQTEWDSAYTNRITSLTTTGTSGAATLISNTLNVPTYTLAGLGGIGGSGTNNYISKFTASGTIGNSIMAESSGLITIYGDGQVYRGQSGTGLTSFFITNDDNSFGNRHETRLATQQLGSGLARTVIFAASYTTNTTRGEFSILTENGANYLANFGTILSGGDNAFSLYSTSNVENIRLNTGGNSFLNGGNVGINQNTPTEKLDVVGNVRISNALAIGTAPDTNLPFKILKNINSTVGIRFENTNTGANAFSALQFGSDVTGGTAFTNFVYASSGVSANGAFRPSGTTLGNTGSGGLNFLSVSQPIRFYTSTGTGTERVVIKNEGQVRFVPLGAAPTPAEAGDVYYDSSTNKLRCYNGTSWNDLF